MKRRQGMSSLLAALFSLSMFIMCGDPIPVKEMSLAKMEITKALSVRADKYAKEEMGIADKKLRESHQLVTNQEYDKAKEAALLSQKKAQEAYEKSIPYLAKDAMEIAEKSLKDSEEVNAPQLSRDEYNQAKKAYDDSRNQFENKKYYESYRSAVEADKLAKNARNTALGRKDVLKDSIAEVKTTLNEAKNYNAAKYAPGKVKAAEESIKVAEDSLNDLKLKQGFSAVEVAKVNADEAYLESLKNTCKDGIAGAQLSLDKASKSAGAKLSKDELQGSRDSLAKARALYAEGKYKDALAAANESKRLSGAVLGARKGVKGGMEVAKNKFDTGEIEGDADYVNYKVTYNQNKRDCLWRIAGKYYKNPYLWNKIYQANRGKIKNPNLLQPGQILRIPVQKKAADVKKEEKTIKPKEDKAVKKDDKGATDLKMLDKNPDESGEE